MNSRNVFPRWYTRLWLALILYALPQSCGEIPTKIYPAPTSEYLMWRKIAWCGQLFFVPGKNPQMWRKKEASPHDWGRTWKDNKMKDYSKTICLYRFSNIHHLYLKISEVYLPPLNQAKTKIDITTTKIQLIISK